MASSSMELSQAQALAAALPVRVILASTKSQPGGPIESLDEFEDDPDAQPVRGTIRQGHLLRKDVVVVADHADAAFVT